MFPELANSEITMTIAKAIDAPAWQRPHLKVKHVSTMRLWHGLRACMQALHRLLLRHRCAASCLCMFLTDPVQGDREVCKLQGCVHGIRVHVRYI